MVVNLQKIMCIQGLGLIKTSIEKHQWLSHQTQIQWNLLPGCKLTDDKLKLLWFNEDRFRPSITRRRQGKQTHDNDAASESSDPEDGPPK